MQIWHLTTTDLGGATVHFAADLDRHQRAVNVVRFSPSGEILASGDDGGPLLLFYYLSSFIAFTLLDKSLKLILI